MQRSIQDPKSSGPILVNLDLSTEYLGRTLPSSIVASASRCTGQPGVLRRLEQCGVGAAVLPSLFEEQVIRERNPPEASDAYETFSHLDTYNWGASPNGRRVAQARQAVTMRIIGRRNGTTPSRQVEQAQRVAVGGADTRELSLHDVPVDGSTSVAPVETGYCEGVTAAAERAQIPMAVEMGPYLSLPPHFVRRVVEVGANGFVLFNRSLKPDVKLKKRTIDAHLKLNRSSEACLSMRWLGILRDQLVCCTLAASNGIRTGSGVLKAMAMGAIATSVVLKHGVEYFHSIQAEMVEWLSTHGYGEVRQRFSSMSRESCGTAAGYERVNSTSTHASYRNQGVFLIERTTT